MLKTLTLFSTFCCLIATQSYSQNAKQHTVTTPKVTLHVIDAETHQYLAYAHIQYGKKGGVTNLEGQISFLLDSQDSIQVRYLGFETKQLYIDPQRANTNEEDYHILVRLQPNVKILEEIIVKPFPTNYNTFKESFLSDDFKDHPPFFASIERMQLIENMEQNLFMIQGLQHKHLLNYKKTGRDSNENFKDQQRLSTGGSGFGIVF